MPLEDAEPRENYTELPMREWTPDEIYTWLWDEGVWTCGDNGAHALIPAEALVEVALQAEILGVELIGRDEIIAEHYRKVG